MRNFYSAMLNVLLIFFFYILLSSTHTDFYDTETNRAAVSVSGTEKFSEMFYFLDDNNLLIEKRIDFEAGRNNLFEVMYEILKDVPEDSELNTLISKDSFIQDVYLIGNSLVLDIYISPIKVYYSTEEEKISMLYQIVNTFTHNSLVNSLRVTINGIPITRFIEGLDEEDIKFQKSMLKDHENTPEAVVDKFISALELRRFDIAYGLTFSTYDQKKGLFEFEENMRELFQIGSEYGSIRRQIKRQEDGEYYAVVEIMSEPDSKGKETLLKRFNLTILRLIDNEYLIKWPL